MVQQFLLVLQDEAPLNQVQKEKELGESEAKVNLKEKISVHGGSKKKYQVFRKPEKQKI